MATKSYLNTGKDDLNVLGVGTIPAGERVSVTSEYLPPVILANYPGLVDVTDEAPVGDGPAGQDEVADTPEAEEE